MLVCTKLHYCIITLNGLMCTCIITCKNVECVRGKTALNINNKSYGSLEMVSKCTDYDFCNKGHIHIHNRYVPCDAMYCLILPYPLKYNIEHSPSIFK